MSDLSCVREELLDVSHQWFDIGLKLKLSVGTLERVRDQYPDPSASLREILLHWLKKVDPPPTWEGLACALESRTVGESRLAEQLRTKYCKTGGAAGQLLYITNNMRTFLATRITNLNYQIFTAKATQWPNNSIHWFGCDERCSLFDIYSVATSLQPH